jgi:hypothetical protein
MGEATEAWQLRCLAQVGGGGAKCCARKITPTYPRPLGPIVSCPRRSPGGVRDERTVGDIGGHGSRLVAGLWGRHPSTHPGSDAVTRYERRGGWALLGPHRSNSTPIGPARRRPFLQLRTTAWLNTAPVPACSLISSGATRPPDASDRHYFFLSGNPSSISSLRSALVSPVKWIACMPNLRAETTFASLSSMNTHMSGDSP